MKPTTAARFTKIAAATMLATAALTANATEGGHTTWPNGIEIYGMGILPPAGTYGQVFVGNYTADTLRGNDGKKAADIDLRVTSITPRFVWVTDKKVFGGDLGFHALLPLMDMRLNIKNGPHDDKRGIGDAHAGVVLGYHPSEKFHVAGGLDFVLPTGKYDKDDIINLGNNHYAAEAVLAMTYMDPSGFNGDVRLMYDYNFENNDTNYRSGDELHLDYTAGWGLGNGWVVGIGGHAYTQVTNDRCGSSCPANAEVRAAHGNKGQSFSIGPSIQYASKNGWQLSAKWQQEDGVRNGTEGQAYWIKFTTAL